MFILLVLIGTYISGSSKTKSQVHTAMSSLQRTVHEHYLSLIELFAINNNYLPLTKTLTVNRIIYR